VKRFRILPLCELFPEAPHFGRDDIILGDKVGDFVLGEVEEGVDVVVKFDLKADDLGGKEKSRLGSTFSRYWSVSRARTGPHQDFSSGGGGFSRLVT
jgi:hypothetical protein